MKVLAALLMLLLPASPARAAPWLSGVNKPAAGWGDWRGQPVDIRTQFFGKRDWWHLRISAAVRADWPQMAIGFPMLPESHAGQLRQCAAGVFASRMRAVRDAMLAAGRRGQFIRLGWEANRVGGFAWAVQGDGASWRGCWRRWAQILNPPGQEKNFQLVWNMANQGTFQAPIEQMWPGDDVVDVVGSQFYDRCPPATTKAEFVRKLNARDRWGNPAGPQQWMNFARSKGKKWAMPEWGIGGSQSVCARPGIDNPDFIRWMHEWLSANVESVAFETYFNSPEGGGSHVLWPVGPNPRASEAYQEIWRQ